MTESHRGIPAHQQTFPRRQFLAYHQLIARAGSLPSKGMNMDEQLTWRQWDAEQATTAAARSK